jgi:SAM-dependent methyltransferase
MKFKNPTLFFSSHWTGVLYSPLYFTRSELYKAIANSAPQFTGKMVDLGCGNKPYLREFINVEEYIGMDVEQSGNHEGKSKVDIFYDGQHFPFEDNSIDGVFSSETFEHIFNLEEVIQEIHRVLKKDGLLLATCPFFWPEHEAPYDFARYTSFALKNLLERNGFEVITYEKTGNYFTAMLQMLALYLYYFTNRIPILNSVLFLVFITPIFALGSLIDRLLPKFMKRKDLYLNNVIVVKKK